MSKLNTKVITATKWSIVTEIAAKLVSPVSSMILARLLAPDAFGVLVTAVMIISFAEIFTDAGFQKYLIQHQFDSKRSLYQSTEVAFWSNLILSLLIWFIIIVCADEFAILVGNEGRGDVIIVSCICIPLAAFSSIQMALYKRNLDFRTLFLVRIVGVFIPLFVTIPIAYYTRSYWALIVGMIVLNISNAIILTIKSEWRPRFFYSFTLFKKMFSFTIWTMFEAISVWLAGYIDIFIVGTILNQYYLGIYRTSMSTVGQIMGLITASTTPVLFSSLSKLQNDDNALCSLFLRYQKIVSVVVIPTGALIYSYSDLVTEVLLGKQWLEASGFIGLWGGVSAIMIVLGHYCSEIFRAKGKPKISVLSQVIYLFVFIPTIYYFVHAGFETLYWARSLVRFFAMIVSLTFLYYVIKISPLRMIINVFPSITGALFVVIINLLLMKLNTSLFWEICTIPICIAGYFWVIFCFPEEKSIINNVIQKVLRKINHV